ncbi:MAG TPA: hypothetical protein VFU81_23300, partial [Thermomicrobiales bacterium]|nr:hypothetical protein [Thermomicrobiales bacterium]
MDKSLLRRSDRLAVGAHYGILETIRGYGLERLEASGEAEIIRRRHASYYRALVEALAPRVKRPELVGGLDRLALELGNLRAAVTWAVAHDEATTT